MDQVIEERDCARLTYLRFHENRYVETEMVGPEGTYDEDPLLEMNGMGFAATRRLSGPDDGFTVLVHRRLRQPPGGSQWVPEVLVEVDDGCVATDWLGYTTYSDFILRLPDVYNLLKALRLNAENTQG